MLRALALGLGLLGASGCSTASAPGPTTSTERQAEGSEAMTRARASVDMFSGREAPAWDLASTDARDVRQAVQALPATTRAMPDVGLGYRGFEVKWEDGAHAKVYRDIVEYTQGGRTVLLEDAGRKLEQRLLSGARQHLAPDLFTAVESQVQLP
ncbi:hypothetical protein JY651_37550 [Pyxidicoccus parkwayensis]|uniref:Lipoprotein n=1 Tax=Pyxidicoccus parkwayensis TaxID=2813578 RepID=A0ABX7NXS4_9BACT|nr:hypothetical protein [Pyxidicoccus parkwaysis]QSQ20888.1 hypothetical protein JY651_37550 [Pyxidicoccus parkwaysis]